MHYRSSLARISSLLESPAMLAEVSFLGFFWYIIAIFFFVMLFWILISILTDLFRDHETSGVIKAIWVGFLLFFTPITMLVYLIARGGGMAERSMDYQKESMEKYQNFIADSAAAQGAGGAGGAGGADELTKLAELRDKGVLTDDEFAAQKAKLLA
jgi:uncharacterized membrane protein YhaH (DUF805 family)